MDTLRGKKVLLFAPKFFNYEEYIKKEIERQGGVVHFYDERNNPSSLEKILFRKAHFLMNSVVNKFYSSICEKEKQFYPDYIVFINAEAINKESLSKLKETFSQSKFIIYMWDSCENKNIKHLFPMFDDCYSFDLNDCEKYGIKFRPLFYIPEFLGQMGVERFDYDFSFIGTVHSDRIKIIQEIKDYCDKYGMTYYFYLYIPGKFLYVLRMLTNSSLRKFERKYIHLVPIDKKTISNVMSRTRCVIDINHPKQTGLTMRTLEMIGMKQKLVTTNQDIKKYDFFYPTNQIIVERNDVIISKKDIYRNYVEISEDIYKKYSLRVWVREIFGLDKNCFVK